jgi:hypothetical protein
MLRTASFAAPICRTTFSVGNKEFITAQKFRGNNPVAGVVRAN